MVGLCRLELQTSTVSRLRSVNLNPVIGDFCFCGPELTEPLIFLVGAARFEPATPCAQGRCATRLRYAPTFTAFLILKHFD